EQTDALSKDGTQSKQGGADRFDAKPQPGRHEIIRTKDFLFGIKLHQEEPDQHVCNDGSNSPLQVRKIPGGGKDHSWHSDKRWCADFRSDDGSTHGRPGEGTACEKEVLNRGLLAAKTVPGP